MKPSAWQKQLPMRPHWAFGIPSCSQDCPSYDRGRCRLTGELTLDQRCESAVGEMAKLLDAYEVSDIELKQRLLSIEKNLLFLSKKFPNKS